MTITARRAATRSRLLEGAGDVIVRKGVGAATVEDICDEAGFTRGAFYSNFDSKDDLLIALLDHHTERINAIARQVIDQAEANTSCDVTEVIRQAIVEFVASGVITPWLVMLMAELQAYAVREPGVREAFTRARRAGQVAKAEMITAALAGHQLRLTVDAGTVTQVLEGAANAHMLDQMSEGREPSAEGLAAVITAVLNAFVAPEPG
ncbi:TetR/AcrR family transcriptional regulator [Aestuariimicrobium soli]|uniref:TetR/AcrR family transcriptional regulator n=1 Tax=Aestuariimicrobium soli TaxID=2035834 RepID=UPI003EC01BA9